MIRDWGSSAVLTVTFACAAVLPPAMAGASEYDNGGGMRVVQYAPLDTRPAAPKARPRAEGDRNPAGREPRKRGTYSDQLDDSAPNRCDVAPPCPYYCREDLRRNACVEGQQPPPQ